VKSIVAGMVFSSQMWLGMGVVLVEKGGGWGGGGEGQRVGRWVVEMGAGVGEERWWVGERLVCTRKMLLWMRSTLQRATTWRTQRFGIAIGYAQRPVTTFLFCLKCFAYGN